VVVSRQNILPVCTLPFSKLLCETFAIEATDDVAVTTELCVANTLNRKGHFVAVGQDAESGPSQFGVIRSFIKCLNSDVWFLVVECATTADFSAHVYAYRVS